MHSPPSGPPNDDDHCCDTTLRLSAAKLDVYRHERLAYTEISAGNSARPVTKRISAMLEALRRWVRSRF
jgi:hypothetical protein